ncbi:MAG: zinc metallopeptidase [Ruminococcaceae bacterium]|nr:zinc metallopeptidase [Oscillospiraceae bacterium]
MLFGLFMGDWTLLILLPAMIFSIMAQIKVKTTFDKYNKTRSYSGLDGASAARMILDKNGLYHVRIERVHGHLTDHFDPRDNVIRLSDSTYNSDSAAAIGVAAHEAGHAVQHAVGYAPIKLRAAIIPVTRVGSALAMPLFLIGMLLTAFTYNAKIGEACMLAGIIFFSMSTLFQLVTLPTEFNASSRAMSALEESGRLGKTDLAASRKVLSAAAMTYVAALATSLAYLLRFIIIFMGASGRRK